LRSQIDRMIRQVRIMLFCLIAMYVVNHIYAGNPYVKNIALETGQFDSCWSSTINAYTSITPPFIREQEMTVPNTRVMIMRDTTLYDVNTGNAIKVIPPGYKYSIKLGNDYPGPWSQHLYYKMKVDSTNAYLVVKFAGVFYNNDYYFRPSLGQNYSFADNSDCHAVSITERLSSLYGEDFWKRYKTYVYWVDWTTVAFNFVPSLGKTVTLDFMTANYPFKGYTYSYIYFVVETLPLYVTVKYCSGDKYATLYAPDGFKSFEWLDSKGKVLGNDPILTVPNPVEGDEYECNLTSVKNDINWCVTAVKGVIPSNEPLNADFTHQLIDCNRLTDSVHFYSQQPLKNNLKLQYKWNFGDGSTSTERNPVHVFKSSGLHTVTLELISKPSTCSYRVSKTVETFSPKYIGISGLPTYCKGYTTTLKGYGAYKYKWSNGSTADSIEVGKDTTVWMIGYSSKGCQTDTIRLKITEEPDLVMTYAGKESYCEGGYTVIWGSGPLAANYLWNTGAKTSSITVRKPGIYTVVASNVRGCEKSKTFNVVEYPKPKVDFTMSTDVIDERHNELVCSVNNETGVQYQWDMGDGQTETGSIIHHNYKNLASILGYNSVTLKAISPKGCVDTSSRRIEMSLFIPTIFTPNGDGMNDLFMMGYDIQIVDRNGTVLYKGNDGWNGTYRGKLMANDTYFYTVSYVDKNHQVQTRKGYISLSK